MLDLFPGNENSMTDTRTDVEKAQDERKARKVQKAHDEWTKTYLAELAAQHVHPDSIDFDADDEDEANEDEAARVRFEAFSRRREDGNDVTVHRTDRVEDDIMPREITRP